MFDLRIRKVMERKKLLVAPPETSVSKAARLMARKNVGAVMVVKNKRLVGIFTERDAVIRVAIPVTASALPDIVRFSVWWLNLCGDF